jgi:AraC-like DNA-binding protein
VSSIIEKMISLPSGKKLINLLYVLEQIAEKKGYTQLSSAGFAQSQGNLDNDRIKVIFEYTFTHYNEQITLKQVASLLNMTIQSFCRYSKNKTKKTYIRFLMEVRIGHACRLLEEDEKNVSEICYESGYNNISHFNHQFKAITKKSPLGNKMDYLQLG